MPQGYGYWQNCLQSLTDVKDVISGDCTVVRILYPENCAGSKRPMRWLKGVKPWRAKWTQRHKFLIPVAVEKCFGSIKMIVVLHFVTADEKSIYFVTEGFLKWIQIRYAIFASYLFLTNPFFLFASILHGLAGGFFVKSHPVCVSSFRCRMSKNWASWKAGKHLAQADLCFVPFENQSSARFQNSPALVKSLR